MNSPGPHPKRRRPSWPAWSSKSGWPRPARRSPNGRPRAIHKYVGNEGNPYRPGLQTRPRSCTNPRHAATACPCGRPHPDNSHHPASDGRPPAYMKRQTAEVFSLRWNTTWNRGLKTPATTHGRLSCPSPKSMSGTVSRSNTSYGILTFFLALTLELDLFFHFKYLWCVRSCGGSPDPRRPDTRVFVNPRLHTRPPFMPFGKHYGRRPRRWPQESCRQA